MTIRPHQFEAFEREARAEFERRVLDHLRTDFADLIEGLSDPELRRRVWSAAARAGRYGLESEYEVVLFLDVTFLTGDERFDENPAHGWAREILSQDAPAEQRADELYDTAAAAFETVQGESDRVENQAG